MASSSSSGSSSSDLMRLPERRNYYDVFVSFRGEDTRFNFTDHLFTALKKKCISAFRDGNDLQKGEPIGPELLRAIKDSRVFVVVFSRNYAYSTWCLQELEMICECAQMSRKWVLPVFYDVDPADVRHQRGIYGKAFVKHEQRFQQQSEKVQRWRKVVTHLANCSGWDLRHKSQSAGIRKIVRRIKNILHCRSSSVLTDLVGMDSRIEELFLLLDSLDEVRAVGICGMGGIGKTTLAMVLIERISHQFGAFCDIIDVRKMYGLHGPLGAQKQIQNQILGDKHHQMCNLYNATKSMRSKLCRKRSLLILDNVDHVEQLEKIVVTRELLGEGSRIIVISRDEHILKQYRMDAVYQVPLLNWSNSLQLLRRKAFKFDRVIMSNYEELAHSILHYSNGLPLAIATLGSFLYGRDISEWRSALDRLRESPNKDVMDVLRLSFDGLEETEKEIFLHIACFFNMHTEKYVTNVLDCCGFDADNGLSLLVDKSLISIQDEMIVMHNLLEELGRKIAQENSIKEPRKWRRLWFDEQLDKVMMDNMEKHVEAIVLDHEYDDYSEEDEVVVDNFSNIRLLIIKYVKLSGSLNYLSNELRYIEWCEYPFMYLPSSFQPNQLVELILEYSSIKQLWEGNNLPKLRTLDLSHSKNLIKMPDFGEIPNLERLNLERCIQLVELDPSIGLLRKIVSLNLKDCKNLVNIPNNIFGLNSLKDLNMSGCSKLFNNPRNLSKRESASHFRSTSSNFKWTMMPYHSWLPTPTTHIHLLPCLLSLSSLRELDISFCGLRQIPEAIRCLRGIERLNIGGNNFVKLPCLRELSKLVYLNLEHCKLLVSLPLLPFLTALEHSLCVNKYGKAIGLLIFNCPKLSKTDQCSRKAFSWMTQIIQTNKEYPAFFDIGIVTPGSEIPSWFNNQSAGDSISVSPLKHENDKNIIGFACCAVFSAAPRYPTMLRSSTHSPHAEMTLRFANVHGYPLIYHNFCLPVILDRDLITVKSNHIWQIIIHFPQDWSYDIMNDIILVQVVRDECLDVEVTNCGYRWIYKQDIQEFNLTMMHPGHSFTRKRKFSSALVSHPFSKLSK
ncbi:disease resistance protein RUN1-like [Vicia villosa]|uniref:disease resistance protein RUN1-like n=1 Tax=Vicia villosa TaxID=3911 RepID=UPI00273C02E7|nr:disease resistance protein RUN1-like [Vicia villosa]